MTNLLDVFLLLLCMCGPRLIAKGDFLGFSRRPLFRRDLLANTINRMSVRLTQILRTVAGMCEGLIISTGSAGVRRFFGGITLYLSFTDLIKFVLSKYLSVRECSSHPHPRRSGKRHHPRRLQITLGMGHGVNEPHDFPSLGRVFHLRINSPHLNASDVSTHKNVGW